MPAKLLVFYAKTCLLSKVLQFCLYKEFQICIYAYTNTQRLWKLLDNYWILLKRIILQKNLMFENKFFLLLTFYYL